MIKDRTIFATGLFLLVYGSVMSQSEYTLGNHGWAAYALFVSAIGALCLRDSIKDQK